MIQEALSFSFFREALLAAIFASICCGVLGSYVVVKRLSSISGGISHAALGGVGFGCFLGISPMLGAMIVAVALSLAVGFMYFRHREHLDTGVAIMWSVGMSLGIVLIALTPGYAPDLSSYLFGNILFVDPDYLILVGGLDILVVLSIGAFFKEVQAVSFDEEFSKIVGVPVGPLFLFVLILIALVVVVLIRLVGVILTIALLTTPAAVARHWSTNLRKMMILSTGMCVISAVGGLFLSFLLSDALKVSLPSGPIIVLLITAIYGISSVLHGFASSK